MREQGKRGLGWLAGHTLPRCSYRHCIFVLAHMRCGSTALSNIFCSRPDTSGYGETHVRHDGPDAPGRLAVNCLRRGSWKAGASFQFDKILHSRLDKDAPAAFFDARAIFLVREPEPTIRSIVRLFEKLRRNEYRNHTEAAEYYIERLDALACLWDRFLPAQRIGFTHKALLADPEGILSRISRQLAIEPALENAYRSPSASRRGGGGDPLMSGRYTRIESTPQSSHGQDEPLDLPVALLDAAHARYAHLQALFAGV